MRESESTTNRSGKFYYGILATNRSPYSFHLDLHTVCYYIIFNDLLNTWATE